MRYFGGKTRSLKWLIPIIEDALRAPHIVGYWEPFVGGASVFSAVRTDKPKIASDSCESIILLWRHLQAGGDLPDAISEAEYAALKRAPESWLKAFVGFGCSFAGRYFGGYARCSRGTNYAGEAKRGALRKASTFRPSDRFLFGSYETISVEGPHVIYCDPPYVGTTPYSGQPKWDADRFWEWARDQGRKGHTVLISEYSAPDWAVLVSEFSTRTAIRAGREKGNRVQPRTERLYTVPSDLPAALTAASVKKETRR